MPQEKRRVAQNVQGTGFNATVFNAFDIMPRARSVGLEEKGISYQDNSDSPDEVGMREKRPFSQSQAPNRPRKARASDAPLNAPCRRKFTLISAGSG
jgi:hypothetical protein